MSDHIKPTLEVEASVSQAPAMQSIAQDVWSSKTFKGVDLGFARAGYNEDTHSGVLGFDCSLFEMDLSLGSKMGVNIQIIPDDKVHREISYVAKQL